MAARNETYVAEQGVLRRQVADGETALDVTLVLAIDLREAAVDAPRGLVRVAARRSIAPRATGPGQCLQTLANARGAVAGRIALQVVLVFGLRVGDLSAAFAREREHFLCLCPLRKLRLLRELCQQRDRRGVVLAAERVLGLGQGPLDLIRRHRCVDMRGRRPHRRHARRSADLVQRVVIRDRHPGFRILAARVGECLLGCRFVDEWPGPQAIPALLVDHGLGHVGARAHRPGGSGECSGVKGWVDEARFTAYVDGALRHFRHRDLRCLGAQQPDAQQAPVDRRRQHERLGLRPADPHLDLRAERPYHVDRAHEASRAGQQWLRFRRGCPATVRARREADLQCFAIGGRRVRHVAHRTAEEQRDRHVATLLARHDVLDDPALCPEWCGRQVAQDGARGEQDSQSGLHQSNFESVMRCSGPARFFEILVSVESVYVWHAPEQLRNSLTVYFTLPYLV